MARKIFDGLQHATLDRSLLTANANSYFSEQVVTDFATSLKPLGSPQQFTQILHRERGGMSLRVYKVQFQQKSLNIWVREMPDGKIEQYQVFTVAEAGQERI